MSVSDLDAEVRVPSVAGDSSASRRLQLRDEVAADLRTLVMSRGIEPGTLVRLAPIAERLGVSLTPVREALLMLVQEGWMSQEPYRGFRVLPIRPKDILDSYLVNAFVAGELAARTAAVTDNALLSHLRGLDEVIREATDRGEHAITERYNSDLHWAIYDACDSPRLAWFVETSARFVPRGYWSRIPGWAEHNRDGHGPIIDALARRDSDESREQMRSHILASGHLLADHIVQSDREQQADSSRS